MRHGRGLVLLDVGNAALAAGRPTATGRPSTASRHDGRSELMTWGRIEICDLCVRIDRIRKFAKPDSYLGSFRENRGRGVGKGEAREVGVNLRRPQCRKK